MIVEIIGIGEHNKGALLMLEAVRFELSRSGLSMRLAVPVTMSRSARKRHMVLGVLPKQGKKAFVLNRLPNALLASFGLVKAANVKVVLDASGFGYGDFWGEAKLRRRLSDRLTGWKTGDRVAVLLPQALGPFRTGNIARQFPRALDQVDLAFVRDRASLDYVREVSDSPAIRQAPDFTNLLHPALPVAYAALRGSSFLIPNEKMILGADAAGREAYFRFMAQAATAIRATGRTPRILVHEGAKDRALAAEINRLTEPMEVVDVASPLDTKALIGAADLIVSSRFHGIVSALSAGVPALACGWSHKYRELMADYGCAEMMVAIGEPDSWTETLDRFLAQAANPAFRGQLNTAAEAQRALSRAMWDETISLIRTRVS